MDIREELFYHQKNGYELISAEDRLALESYCRGYMEFLNEARTEREAVKLAIAQAEALGFTELKAGMSLQPGSKVYYSNRGKALYLAVIGKKSLDEGCVIA